MFPEFANGLPKVLSVVSGVLDGILEHYEKQKSVAGDTFYRADELDVT